MSGELRIATSTGSTVYGLIYNASSRVWDGSSFVAYSSGSYPDYVVSVTENGSSGVYIGDFPSGISDAGSYEIIYYVEINAPTAAEGDPFAGAGRISWDGSAITDDEDTDAGEVSASDWETHIVRTFKRTDKSTDLFEFTNAAIAEIRRKFRTSRDEKETPLTDTISTLGEYKLDLESDTGLLISDIFVRDSGNGQQLDRISKSLYDALYGKWGTGNSERGLPCHYCIFGGQVLLGPVPDSIDYVYVISYSQANLASVTSASTAVPFTTRDYKEILSWGVLWRLFSLVENDDQTGKYKAFWDDGLDQIETRERRNRQGVTIVAQRDC